MKILLTNQLNCFINSVVCYIRLKTIKIFIFSVNIADFKHLFMGSWARKKGPTEKLTHVGYQTVDCRFGLIRSCIYSIGNHRTWGFPKRLLFATLLDAQHLAICFLEHLSLSTNFLPFACVFVGQKLHIYAERGIVKIFFNMRRPFLGIFCFVFQGIRITSKI